MDILADFLDSNYCVALGVQACEAWRLPPGKDRRRGLGAGRLSKTRIAHVSYS